jgi:hypothetical protein
MQRSFRAYPVAPALLLVLTAPVLLAGCGLSDELSREAVFGTVTLNGQPLKKAMIVFEPSLMGPSTGASGLIVDGRYSIAKAWGAAPGEYRVLIFAGQTEAVPVKAEISEDSPPAPPPNEPIPARYNQESDISVEVLRNARNQFDLELKDP